MAAPAYTYSLTNGTTADASQVMQDFNDILNGVTDGTKDLTFNAATVNGSANLKAAVTLGASSANDLTVNGALASTIAIKTNNTYAIGSATKGITGLFLGNAGLGATCQILSASHATTRNYTIPDCGAAASFVMTKNGQTIDGLEILTNGTGADVTPLKLRAGTTTGLVRSFLNNSDDSRTFEIDGNFGSGTEKLQIQSDSASLVDIPRNTSSGDNGRAKFYNGLYGNSPTIYSFTNLTGVTAVANFTDGTLRASGSAGVTKTFGSSTVTLTFPGNACWYLVTIEASAKFVGGSAASLCRLIITLGGTGTRYNASSLSLGTADNKVEFNGPGDGNADPISFSTSFYLQTTAASQTLTALPTFDMPTGTGTGTCGLVISAVPV